MYEYIKDNSSAHKEKLQNQFNKTRLKLNSFHELSNMEIRKRITSLFNKIGASNRQYIEDCLEDAFIKRKKLKNCKDVKDYMKIIGFDIDKYFDTYSRTLLFVYLNELQRREARYAEGTIAIGDMNSADMLNHQKRNVSSMSKMADEVAVDAERESTLLSFKHDGFTKVVWVSEMDDRVCGECELLNGQVFDIDNVPERPHQGCRCEIEPYQ